MLATALIVFRETLEAALIITIVLAATKGVAARGLWVAGGVGAGILGALVVAMFASAIAAAAAGAGQELFNAGVLFAAVAMLGWHNVWMSRHGRQMAAQMTSVGEAVATGTQSLHVLGVVVGLAVLREGSEVVLFMYGLAAGGASAGDLVLGSVAGLAGGAAIGIGLYFGLLQIPTRYLFTVTSWLILLLAAGLAATGAKYLAQAGILPALGYGIWDTSWLLSDSSVVGEVLHVLVGYVAKPSGIQIVFYGATVLLIGGCMKLYGGVRPVETRTA